VVLVNADPFRMRDLVGREQLPDEYNSRLDDSARDGTTLKVNLALDGLPEFTCLKENKGQHHTTIHILPQHDVIASLGTAFSDARAGKLPDFPAVEWYTHTTVDPSLRDPGGHHNAALFVQWVPYSIAESTWAAEEERYVDHLLSLCDRFAPGTSARVSIWPRAAAAAINSAAAHAMKRVSPVMRAIRFMADDSFQRPPTEF
jgi:phytoene dehydrogenase-like protein